MLNLLKEASANAGQRYLSFQAAANNRDGNDYIDNKRNFNQQSFCMTFAGNCLRLFS